MIKTLQCPACAAPLEYDEEGERETIRCHFCNSTAVLPHRPRAQQQNIRISFGRPRMKVTKGSPAVAIVVVVLVLFIGGGVVIGVISAISSAVTSVPRSVVNTNTRTTLNPPSAPARPPEPTPFFGKEGVGAGHFQDARSIAIDGEGRIYVGEYSGGRVQVFDKDGKFITQWTTTEPKFPLRGMTADRRGTVYVVQRSAINKYEGTTGRHLGTTGAGGGHYDDVWATPDGGLVAFSRKGHDNVVRIDSSGQVRQVIEKAASGPADESELSIRVAADGVGNVYALGTFTDAVFKYSPDGRFLTRFGGDGDEPGLFRAPGAIAVDNQGRVYVADFKGVQVFDPNGRYLKVIDVKGAASGLAFTDKNELLVVARTAVWKFNVEN